MFSVLRWLKLKLIMQIFKNFLPSGLKMNMRITLKLYQQIHQWFSKCASRPAATASPGSFLQTQILKPLTYWVRPLSSGAYQSESQPGLQVILMGLCGSSFWESWGCKGGSQDWHDLGVCETRRPWSSPHISCSRICMLAGASALSSLRITFKRT